MDISRWNFTKKVDVSGKVVILGKDVVEQANQCRRSYPGQLIFVMRHRPTPYEVANFPLDDCLIVSEHGTSESAEFKAAQRRGLLFANNATGAIDQFRRRGMVTLDLTEARLAASGQPTTRADHEAIERQARGMRPDGDIGNGMSERQDFYFAAGNQLYVAGLYADAESLYEKADALAPGHPSILNNRGGNFTRWGKLEQAERAFRACIRHNLSHQGAHKNLGDVLVRLGRHQEALGFYETALRLTDNDYARAWWGKGNVFLASEKYPEAEDCYRRAVAQDPTDAKHFINLGASLSMQDRDREALAEYLKARELDPEFPGLQQTIDYLRDLTEEE